MAGMGDPFSAFAANFGSGVGKGVGDAISGGGGPFIGGASSAMAYGTTMDGSAWVVNVNGTQNATASPVRNTSNGVENPAAPGFPMPTAMAGVSLPMMIMLGLAAVAFIKRKGA